MDLSLMREKAGRGDYRNVVEFVADFKKMCNNALTYNRRSVWVWMDVLIYISMSVVHGCVCILV